MKECFALFFVVHTKFQSKIYKYTSIMMTMWLYKNDDDDDDGHDDGVSCCRCAVCCLVISKLNAERQTNRKFVSFGGGNIKSMSLDWNQWNLHDIVLINELSSSLWPRYQTKTISKVEMFEIKKMKKKKKVYVRTYSVCIWNQRSHDIAGWFSVGCFFFISLFYFLVNKWN